MMIGVILEDYFIPNQRELSSDENEGHLYKRKFQHSHKIGAGAKTARASLRVYFDKKLKHTNLTFKPPFCKVLPT